jgi:hypothetical protein
MAIEGIGQKTVEKIRSACAEAVEEAEKKTESGEQLTREFPSEMEFSPDDLAEPRIEDY